MFQRIAEEIYGFGIDPDPKGFGIGSLFLGHPRIHKRTGLKAMRTGFADCPASGIAGSLDRDGGPAMTSNGFDMTG
jgi:hypothetical protein